MDNLINESIPDGEEAIIFDTETTGLPKANSMPLDKQPQIIEFAAIRVNWRTLEELDRMTFFCKNRLPLEPIITNITGLTDEDLIDAKPFSAYYSQLAEFHLGAKHWVAHNIAFDRKLMVFDLKRISKATHFPYPPNHICTVDQSYCLNNFKLKQEKLHAHYYSEDPAHHDDAGNYKGYVAHRAMNDVEALFDCVKGMRKDGLL